jgi:hypothetical protein
MRFPSGCLLALFLVVSAVGCTRGRSDSSDDCDPGEDDCDKPADENDLFGGSGGASGQSGATGGASGVSGATGSGGAAGTRAGTGGMGAGAGAGGAGSGAGGLGGAGAGGFGGGAGGFGGAGFGGFSGGMGGAPASCFYEGVFRREGERFASDCNECLCTEGTVLCTDAVCPGLCDADECRIGNVCYSHGSTNILAPDECNRCTCFAGALYCTAEEHCGAFCEPSSCFHNSTCYADGALGIAAGDGCNTCSCDDGDLLCTDAACERFDAPPCEADKCEIDGICYPLGETTEDGCCLCEEDGVTCSDATWCDGQNPIGTRCDVDGDCQPGLDCRHDLAGERGMCMRDCGYGCPEGTECADGIPGYNGGSINNICLRTCMVSADCATFGSQCDQPTGADRRYCF